MNRTRSAWLACFLFVVAGQLRADNWPQWRGPYHNGFSKETKLPVEWNESKNIAWKLTLPGMGSSTPIVWDDKIFLTCQDGDDIVLLCIGVDGKVAWKRKLASGTSTYRKDEGNLASATASTDGKLVFVFVGTGDVACFDFDGKEVWKTNAQDRYGKFRIMHGMHITPLLHEDRLYMPLLHQGGQWVVALDKNTGKEIWKVARPTDGKFEGEHSYASPCLYQNGAESYLVVHGCDYTTGHKLSDGSEIWRLGDLNLRMPKDQTFRLVASPAVANDVIVVPTAKNGPVVAIKPSAKGMVKSGSEYEVWRKAKGTTDVPTPLIHDGLVYMCKENGMLVVMDAKTGEEYYSERLHSGRYRGSPVFADGKVYLTSRDGGVVTVVAAGKTFKKLAENKLPDIFNASPAIANGRIYLRGYETLWAIESPK